MIVVKKVNFIALGTLLLILCSQWFVFQQKLEIIHAFHHVQKEQFQDMHRDPFPIEHNFKERVMNVYKEYGFMFGFLGLSILFCLTFLVKKIHHKYVMIARTVLVSCIGITFVFYFLDQLLTSIYL